MYSVSVKNLYIGKSGITFRKCGVIEPIIGRSLTTLVMPSDTVGSIANPVIHTKDDHRFEPDYVIPKGIWDSKPKPTYTINETMLDDSYDRYMLWFTGIPLTYVNLNKFIFPDSVYTCSCKDQCHQYIIQVTKYDNKYSKFINI